MKSDPHNKDAIDFLALVRQDLEHAGSTDTPSNSIATSRFEPADSASVETISSLPDVYSPTHFGRFQVIEQIGEGGFAKVYLAKDPNLDRAVALKVPKPHALVSAEARLRFEREAKSAAILSHPNIVPVFESGSAGPISFIASEYCPGANLRIWFAASQKKPSPRTAVKIVSRLADALQHAHRRGIIHRDLKPANIIVVDLGEEDIANRLRITDFGLARRVSCEETLTVNGAIVGTPAYMSPEQAEGVGKVDHRTDVYSLGMILFELLTGKIPFKRLNHIASIAAVINEPVPSPRQFNGQVDADLEAICLKALEKEPAARYQSARELELDLQRWLEGEAVSVRELSRTEMARRWVTKNPLVASAILFSLLCLTIGFATSFVQWKQSQANLLQSIKQQDRAERNVEELHRTIISALETSLDTLEKKVSLLPGQQDVLDQLMDAHLRLIEEEAEEVEITPSTFECYERLAGIYRITGRYDRALAICERAEKVLEPCLADAKRRKTFALSASNIAYQKGQVFGEQGETDTFLAFLLKAKAFHVESESAVDRSEWLRKGFYLFREIAFLHFSAGDLEKSQTAFDVSGEMAVEAVELNPEDELLQYNFAKTFGDISHLYRRQDNWQVGLEYLELAEELFESAEARFLASTKKDSRLSADNFKYRLAYIRNEMAHYLHHYVRDFERAEEYSLRAIESLEQLVDENPGQLGYQNRLSHSRSRLAILYYAQEMFDETLQVIDDSIEVHRNGKARWAEDREANAEIMRGKIWAFEYNEPVLAEAAFDRAVDIIESSERFKLGDDRLVDVLIRAHRQRDLFYRGLGETEKVREAIGSGYQLAVFRALEFPTEDNAEEALRYGIYFSDNVFEAGQFEELKTILDTTAEATRDSADAQFALAKHWAKYDSQQRDKGIERKTWKASRNRSLQLLSRAIELGFSDYESIQNESYFKDYQLLPEFKAVSERIKPAESVK